MDSEEIIQRAYEKRFGPSGTQERANQRRVAESMRPKVRTRRPGGNAPNRGGSLSPSDVRKIAQNHGTSMDAIRDLAKAGKRITPALLRGLGIPGAIATVLSFAPEIRELNESIKSGPSTPIDFDARAAARTGRTPAAPSKTAAPKRTPKVDTTDDARAARSRVSESRKPRAPAKPAKEPSRSTSTQRVGIGSSKTVKVGGRELANVSAEQLKAATGSTSKDALRKYMNKWNSKGSRPTASDFQTTNSESTKKMARGGLVRSGKMDYRKGGMVYK